MHGYEIRRDRSSGITVAKFIAQHIDALSGVQRKTLAEYRRYLTRGIEPILGYVPLEALNRADNAQLGDTWKSWGWYVTERDGFRKPNRFGYAPDGYILQIMAKDPVPDPPTLKGDSPCFSGDLPDNRGPFPVVLKAD